MPKQFPIKEIVDNLEEFVAIRHQLHRNPELGFEETETSNLVAEKLKNYGYEVHRGLGKTGVVGVLKKGHGAKSIGLRADMDALPVQEATGLPYASQSPGKMHACGHDGHTTSLLATARHLAQHTHFNGTVNLIFQPAEEGLGGARHMLEEGLLERFPCDAVFAYHNMPGMPAGQIGSLPGSFMTSSDTVNITVKGKGGHGSMPHLTVDATITAAYIAVALQSVVSRNIDPRKMAVVSIGALHAGTTSNVIAETAKLVLTVRAYDPAIRALLRERITAIATNQAAVFGAEVEIDYQWRYPALHNDPSMTELALDVAREWVGKEGLIEDLEPQTGSEDFSFILNKCPGCYLLIGNGATGAEGGEMVHTPRYNFNDKIIPVAASYWVRLVERFLA